MKIENPELIELRLKNNISQIYWTYSSWKEEEIDGEMFTPVTKFMPHTEKITELYYVKTSNLEKCLNFD
jgi:hypothetical protein